MSITLMIGDVCTQGGSMLTSKPLALTLASGQIVLETLTSSHRDGISLNKKFAHSHMEQTLSVKSASLFGWFSDGMTDTCPRSYVTKK